VKLDSPPGLSVSVLMPVFNGDKTINSAIISCINQTFFNWELIIVNDGSTDTTGSIINGYVDKDKRIKYYSYKQNKGRGYARQYALDHSNGDLIAFLDADDLWHPEKLERQINMLTTYNVKLVACRVSLIERNSEIQFTRKVLSNSGINRINTFEFVPFFHPTALVDIMLARQVGYDGSKRSLEDDVFFKKYLSLVHGEYYMIDEVLYYYREYESWSIAKIWTYWKSGYLISLKQRFSILNTKKILFEPFRILIKLLIAFFFGTDAIVRNRNVRMKQADINYHTEIVKQIYSSLGES
jgi:glycosyltransferase involved in cell wall biosynthesis